MAKERKSKSSASGFQIGVWPLFFIATFLLIASWLMKSFPVLIFIAIAPLFAIVDKSSSEEKIWNHAELILVAIVLALLAGHVFQLSYLVISIIQAICFTLAFVGYAFVHQSLGSGAGKFIIIIFWLAIEYAFLKVPGFKEALFLADAVQLKTSWLNWTFHTGYLGSSLWILLTNLFFYFAILKEGKINWLLIIVSLGLMMTPIIFSYTIELDYVKRSDLEDLYFNQVDNLKTIYAKRGELIPRTAAWISILIITFAMVKSKTRNR